MKLNLIIAFFLSSFISVQFSMNDSKGNLTLVELSWGAGVANAGTGITIPKASSGSIPLTDQANNLEIPVVTSEFNNPTFSNVGTSPYSLDAKAPPAATLNNTCLDEDKMTKVLAAIAKKEFAACSGYSKAANVACLWAPEWGTAFGGINALLPVIQGAKSQGDACKAHSSAMDIAQKALSGYNVTCGAAKFICENRCKAAIANLEKSISDSTQLQALIIKEEATISKTQGLQTGMNICFEAENSLKGAQAGLASEKAKVAHEFNICEGYGTQLMGSAMSLLSVLKKKGDDAQCACVLNPDTKECQCQKDPTLAQCIEPINCEDPKNAANVTCICQKSGNKVAGCPGGADAYKPPQVQRTQSNQVKGLTDEFGNPIVPSGSTGNADQGAPSANIANTGSGSALGSGGGGGGANAGLSPGGVGAGVAPKTGKEKSSGMNANVISGYEGGGGGFGSGYGGNRFGEDGSSVDPALAAKAKAAARDLASQKGSGLTGSGGKDNFQKVRENYQTQKPSLLNR